MVSKQITQEEQKLGKVLPYYKQALQALIHSRKGIFDIKEFESSRKCLYDMFKIVNPDDK